MIKEQEIEQKIIVKKRYCDNCSTQISNILSCSVAKCDICHKDLCNECVFKEEHNTGDYRTVFCKQCCDIGEKYVWLIDELQTKIDSLTDEWHRKCLSANGS